MQAFIYRTPQQLTIFDFLSTCQKMLHSKLRAEKMCGADKSDKVETMPDILVVVFHISMIYSDQICFNFNLV